MIADDMIGYVKSDLINFGIGVFIFILVSNETMAKVIAHPADGPSLGVAASGQWRWIPKLEIKSTFAL